MEAAETLEEAVRREAFEETGIIVDRVAYHSSQPWVILEKIQLSKGLANDLTLIFFPLFST